MSRSIEEHIGEGRPWPEQVVVYRGETDESLTYARRSLSDVNKMVELMDTLAAENARLRELVQDMLHDAMENVCSKAYWCGEKSWQACNDKECGNRLYVEMARELGVIE